nr:SPOR domain-containing protein [Marinobacter daepoensis]
MLDKASGETGLNYTKGERQGRDWFMLVHGQYQSRDEALAAASRLPPALTVVNPWIRPYSAY